MPRLIVECQSVDASFVSPYHENQLVITTCQLPDPPERMFNSCYREKNVKITGICSRLVLGLNKYTTIVTPTNATYHSRSIIQPEYWLADDIIRKMVEFQTGNPY